MKSSWVHESICSNWSDWRKEFEHGNSNANPILTDSDRFRQFCKEYSVQRTIKANTQKKFQEKLRDLLPKAIASDKTGSEIDRIEKHLRSKFGTHDGTRPLISVTSKVATFLRPDTFIAWDSWAQKGLNIALGNSKTAKWKNYQTYLTAAHDLLNNEDEETLHLFIRGHESKIAFNGNSFRMRVLDTYLMWKGGRWADERKSFV